MTSQRAHERINITTAVEYAHDHNPPAFPFIPIENGMVADEQDAISIVIPDGLLREISKPKASRADGGDIGFGRDGAAFIEIGKNCVEISTRPSSKDDLNHGTSAEAP